MPLFYPALLKVRKNKIALYYEGLTGLTFSLTQCVNLGIVMAESSVTPVACLRAPGKADG
jgi:hypothetical protein